MNKKMPHTIDEKTTAAKIADGDNVCRNMVSNLPLLFAAGYPTSLDKITETQLEKFIPFMVQCSLGNIQINGNIEYSEPEWWPEDIVFTIPLVKNTKSNWHAKLKEIVIICYSFHKSVFLLRFCNELAAYQPECLRFINNYNSTTSLFDRVSNKLLVTFRNENMLYDQLPVNNKKTLLPRVQSSQTLDNNNDERMVEAALFDIYLCDNCEAELYSLDAYREHEKICEADDDVIFCGMEEQQTQIDTNFQKQTEFLKMFDLFHSSTNNANNLTDIDPTNNIAYDQSKTSSNKRIPIPNDIQLNSPQKKLRRLPRRSRTVMALARCPNIAISSPAGQQIFKLSKTVLNRDYLYERLERLERFCHAPPLGDDMLMNGPKFLYKKYNYLNISHHFKRPPGYYYHYYNFPRRQFAQKTRLQSFLDVNVHELKQCKPLSVRLERLSPHEINLACQNLNNVIRLKTIKNIDIIIDLCSSDDDVDNHNNGLNDENKNSQENCRSKDRISGIIATSPQPFKHVEYKSSDSPEEKPRIHNVLNIDPVAVAIPLKPTVLIFSNLSKSPIPLHEYHNYNSDSNYQNENNLSFLNGVKKPQQPIMPSHKDALSLGPDIVIKRLETVGKKQISPLPQPTSQQTQQISIDLT